MGGGTAGYQWTPHKRRGPIAAEFSGPGPAAIALPSLIGNAHIKESTKIKSPAYTFGVKSKQKTEIVAPSPNSYNTSGLTARGKDAAPSSSLHIRPKDPKKFLTPSPGAYNPEKADKEVRGAAAKYSFGIKADMKKVYDSPAPNAYTIAQTKDMPAYSLASRAKDLRQFATPAPGSYEVEVKEEKEAKSFGVKHSPFLYQGKMKGDNYVTSKTENGVHINGGASNGYSQTYNGATNGGLKITEHVEYRQRSGTFTRDKPSTVAFAQPTAVA